MYLCIPQADRAISLQSTYLYFKTINTNFNFDAETPQKIQFLENEIINVIMYIHCLFSAENN